MKLYTRLLFTVFAILVLPGVILAQFDRQNSVQKLRNRAEVKEVRISDELGTPSSIVINASDADSRFQQKQAGNLIRDYFSLSEEDEVRFERTIPLAQDIEVQRFQRYYNGIKIEHGDYVVASQGGVIKTIYAEHYNMESISRNASISEADALSAALIHLNGAFFAWEADQQFLDQQDDLNPKIRAAIERTIQEEYPTGELVYIKGYYDANQDLELAYKFIIESVDPLFKDKVYVSASDGKLLLRDPMIKHGSGDTRYAGTRNFPTTMIDVDTFELKGNDPISGVRLDTRSVEGIGGLPISVGAIYVLAEAIRDGDQSDPCPTDGTLTTDETGDDIWNEAEHQKAPFEIAPLPAVSCCQTYSPLPGSCNEAHNDDIALDAHWGASVVSQYWLQKHGRNSYDGEGADIFSFVHYGDAYDNAFWNGSYMTYGDGSYQKGTNPNGSFAPLTSMDVCAHEIGHAICSFTSDLVYQRESGAMNEGFSDIWAAAIERFVLDSIDGSLDFDPFGIGEQIDERDGGLPPGDPASRALRWMDDPQASGDPDTYDGINWTEPECGEPTLANDYCGVHSNSGVLNKWFYLLTIGSGASLTPGLNKALADDQLNDLGNPYSVVGLGYDKAEKIAFLGETLLLSNSKFADMRAASIDAAHMLYGPCSNEEIQTTNAWHAVGVGPEFIMCGDTIAFLRFNPKISLETSGMTTCDATRIVNMGIYAVQDAGMSETIQITTSGDAVLGEDYTINSNTITFTGEEIKNIEISIIDDLVSEDNDTIILSFTGGGYSGHDTLIIFDDDVIPFLGGTQILVNEGFSSTALPAGWQRQLVNPESANDWFFDGTGAPGVAYAALPGSQSPTYNQAADATVRLVTPMLDARGMRDIQVSFDWQAGGEVDAADGSLYDYGTFQISHDNTNWTDVENYVGSSGGNVIESGSYTASHPELDNSVFYLGFRWYNDALVGSGFSFTVDNVFASGEGLLIETEVDELSEAYIPADQDIYLTSSIDNDIIARVSNAAVELGCTQVKVSENDTINDAISAVLCDQRSSKVFALQTENITDEFTLTLYFAAAELNDWTSPTSLNILAVENADIDDYSNGYSIISNDEITIDDQLATNGYISYSFTTTGAALSYALTDRQNENIGRQVLNSADMGTGSLRETIGHACPSDTIFFNSSLILDTIKLAGSEILIDKNLVIVGLGPDQLFISGENNSRIFNIDTEAQVFAEQLTLIKGVNAMNGGAIFNQGNLTLKNVTISESLNDATKRAITNNGTLILSEQVKLKD